ncbi:MAG: class I SAM-dependent methyltransferase [Proteobacteria bacterium]|nr:class I SAM-dependent methyltransferase [Pseudomonadota bacterium]
MSNLLQLDQHFAFGENWQSFAQVVNEDRVAQSEAGMRKLFPGDELKGATFLDIGCGSGLSSVAASRLGVSEIEATDIDPNSVTATTGMLSRFAPGLKWNARVCSVFDLPQSTLRQFDVVYSWGVLHHTGDMWRAVGIAASMVKPGGYFALALYKKTPLCGFWKREKHFYAHAPRVVQAMISGIFKFLNCANILRHGRNPFAYIRNYRARGMSWSHDVHDWLGGYPYESASPDEVTQFLKGLGFEIVRECVQPPSIGIWGSGCDEFVAVRTPK